jgi:hypothetical protein
MTKDHHQEGPGEQGGWPQRENALFGNPFQSSSILYHPYGLDGRLHDSGSISELGSQALGTDLFEYLMTEDHCVPLRITAVSSKTKFHKDLTSFIWDMRFCLLAPSWGHIPMSCLCTRACALCRPTNNINQPRRPLLTYTESFVKIWLHLAEILRCLTLWVMQTGIRGY